MFTVNKVLRFLSALPGILMLSFGIRWIVTPATVAAEMRLPLLEDMARSTQIGELGAFLSGTGLLILIGVVNQGRVWLYAASLMLSITAVFRSVAWMSHDAPLATQIIIGEMVVVLLLLVTSTQLEAAK